MAGCGKLRGKKIVWTVHNLEAHGARHPRRQRVVLRRLGTAVKLTIVHSRAAVPHAAQQFSFRQSLVRVIPHANYLADYPPAPTKANARAALGLNQGESVFLFIGQVKPYKGLEELVQAFSSLDGDHMRLVIAGRPTDEEFNQQLKHAGRQDPRIDYRPGFVPQEQVPAYLAACDVVTLPYRKILTSGSLLLAASFGRAAIVPRVDSLLESAAPDGVIAFEPTAQPVDSLRSAIRQAPCKRKELAAMGERNREHVAAWGWPEMTTATAVAYGEVVTSPPAET